MKVLCPNFVLIALLSVGLHCPVWGDGASSKLPTAREVYQLFIKENGGRSNILAFKTLMMSGRILESGAEGHEFKLYRKRPSKMRLRVTRPEGVASMIYNGEQGWKVWRPNYGDSVPLELDGNAIEALKEDSHFDSPLFRLGGRLDVLTPVAIEEVLGEPALRLDVDPAAGSVYASIWVSTQTYQEVKLLRRLSDEDDSSADEIESVLLSNFEKVQGVFVPYRIEQYARGGSVKVIEVQKIKINVGLFDSYFTVQK